jgi:O-antigen ligase
LAQPVCLALLAWAAWSTLSLVWSPDRDAGLTELADLRFMLLVPALWPLIEYRRQMTFALIAGFALGHVMQLVHAVFDGHAWVPFEHMPGRFPGWWGGATAGTLLTAALGLHLPAAILGTGRTRLVAIALALVTLLGLLASGARGGWIASSLLVAIVLVAGHRRHLRRLLVVGGFVLALVLAAGLVLRGPIMTRVTDASREIAAAFDREEFTSSTGARIAMGQWGLRAFAANPVAGVGAGGYQAWVQSEIDRRGLDRSKYVIHDSAHSAPIHIAATGGLVGVALAGILGACIAWAALRSIAPGQVGTYAAGPACALLGLALVSVFDTIHLSSRSGALLGVLLALCPTVMPSRARQ